MLVGLAEHGVTPSVQAARMTLAAAPGIATGRGWRAGIAGAGSVVLGAAEEAGRLLARGIGEADGDAESFETAARRLAMETPVGAQAGRGLRPSAAQARRPARDAPARLAHDRGAAGDHTRFLEVLAPVVNDVWQRTLPVNINGAIAAIMLDLEFPMEALRGVPILARTAGLLGHLYEETQRPMGFLLAHHAEAAVEYDGEPPPSERE